MTTDQLPLHELDAILAERVMGWPRYTNKQPFRVSCFHLVTAINQVFHFPVDGGCRQWSPTTDARAMVEVLNKLIKTDYAFCIKRNYCCEKWECCMFNPEGQMFSASADDLMLAVARAAAKATETMK